MEIKNIFIELQNAPVDKSANIKLIRLTGDNDISVFAAEVSPKTELNPHFHQFGIETYQVIQGEGVMKVGKLIDNKLIWDEIINVSSGDCFSINEGFVHQIVNESEKPLMVLFTCPATHLSSDRYFIDK